jgi:hypothetical protein
MTASFLHGKSFDFNLDRKWSGYILGDFFTNYSGHTAADHAEAWAVTFNLLASG